MKNVQFSLRTKLTLSFLLIIIIGGIALLIIGSRLVRETLITQAQAKVRHDLASAWMVFDEKLGSVKDVVRLTAARESLRDALLTGKHDILLKYLGRVRTENGLDILTLIDEHGRVLLRTRPPQSGGDDQSGDELVRRAFQHETVAFPQIVPREELLKEGEDLAAQASMDFVPTLRAAPRPGNRETNGLMLKAASPIQTEDGRIVGVLTGGVLLNRNYEIVDRIKEIVFKGELYKGRDTGTATIFQNDLRISTNVKNESGDRAVGTFVSEEVKRAVLDEGQPWVDRAFVVNDWYITAYEPITDPVGRRIGILYVGMLEKPYLDTAQRITRTFLLIAGLCVVILLLVLNFSTARIIRPLQRMAAATKIIARGDLAHRVEVTSRDEVGALADSFNRMIEHLREANDKLVEYGKTLEKKVEERTRELRDIQTQLFLSEKLASIGKLAAGIAHEINNPLGGILIYSHLILEETPKSGPNYENLKKIIKETTRCKEIVKGLLDFARPREPEMSATDVHELLDKCLTLTEQHALFQNIRVEKSYDPSIPRIIADSGQLQQVFMNIILNAAEAMNGSGTLTLRTAFHAPKDEVTVEFADTGHGIPEADMDRLFEPFFTTKEVGKGTGLGLAISYGIIQKHQGTIEVRNQPGQGAVFTITLPLKRAGS